MTYEEAIKYLTPHPTNKIIQFSADDLRKALEAIEKKVEELEHENELKEWPADDFGSDNER